MSMRMNKDKNELWDCWENMYNMQYTGNKYKKNTKNFSMKIHGKSVDNPNIYIIPRQRGGPSYKDVLLEYDNAEEIQFCPISKGYSMQDVSSFTLGPVVNHGLNIVNSAFSKCIAIKHIDGSGIFSDKTKMFWKKYRKSPIRNIIDMDEYHMMVDGILENKKKWLEMNLHLWFDNWKNWHDAIRMSANGNFNWCSDSETIIYCNCVSGTNEYMNFVNWKKSCYISPAYELFDRNDNRVIQFLKYLYHEKKISIGLVHPMGKLGNKENAITSDYIRELYDCPYDMTCMPYVVAGYLLGVCI